MNRADLVLTRQGIRYAGRLFPCAVGKGGITTDKREGDGATPAGIHQITGLYYRADRLSAPAPWARPSAPAICGAMPPITRHITTTAARP